MNWVSDLVGRWTGGKWTGRVIELGVDEIVVGELVGRWTLIGSIFYFKERHDN